MADFKLEVGQDSEHFEPLQSPESVSLDASRQPQIAGSGKSEHPLRRRGLIALASVLGLMAVWAVMPAPSPSTANKVQDGSKFMPQEKMLWTEAEMNRAWAALGGKEWAFPEGGLTPDQEKAQAQRMIASPECKDHPKCGKDTGMCCPNELGQVLGCCGYKVLDYNPVLNWNGFMVRRDYHPDPPWQSAPPADAISYWNPHNVHVEPQSKQLQICVVKNSGFMYAWKHGVVPLGTDNPKQAWANGEAVFDNHLFYGTYIVSFSLVDALTGAPAIERLLSKDVTFTAGVFIYDIEKGGEGENGHRELDLIEVGYQNMNRMDPKAWINSQPGGPHVNKSNAHFALQPVKINAAEDGQQTANFDHVNRLSIDPAKMAQKGGITVVMRWHGPKKPVSFFAAHGDFTSANFPFKGADTMSWKTPKSANEDVPSRTDSHRLHLNLWAYGGPSSDIPFCMRVNHVEIPPAPKGSEA